MSRRRPCTGGNSSGASAWALGTPGKAYALYLHHGSQREAKPKYFVDATPTTAKLQLALPSGAYDIRWLDPKSGKVTGQRRLSHSGGPAVIVSPSYTEDVALRIESTR